MKVKILLTVVMCFAGQAFQLGSWQALAQDSSNVRTIGFWPYGPCYAATHTNIGGTDYAVIGSGGGVMIINVNTPSAPVKVGEIATPGIVNDVTVSGSYAYVADGYSGLRIINISDPANPAETGFHDTPGWAYGVTVSGSYAYVADYGSGLRIIDISNPANPVEAGYYDTPGGTRGVAISGNYTYVADYDAGLRIYEGYGPAGVTGYPLQNANFKVQNVKLRVYGNTIEYSVPQSGTASLKIYNLLGQEVNTLFRKNKIAGSYKITWNGRDDSGRRVSSGVYLVRLEANGQAVTGKMPVVR